MLTTAASYQSRRQLSANLSTLGSESESETGLKEITKRSYIILDHIKEVNINKICY